MSKRLGRPPLGQGGRMVSMTVSMPPSWADTIYRRAQAEGKSAPAVVRELMAQLFSTEKYTEGEVAP